MSIIDTFMNLINPPTAPKFNKNISNGYFSNGYQPNNINGVKLNYVKDSKGNIKYIKDTPMKGSVNSAGKSMDNQKIWSDTSGNFYVWVGNGGTGGYYAKVNLFGNGPQTTTTDFSGYIPDNAYVYHSTTTDKNGNVNVNQKTAGMYLDLTNVKPNEPEPYKPETNKTETNNAGGNTYINYTAPAYDDSAIRAQLQKLTELYEEATKVYSADELAAHYDIKDTLANENYYKNMYTDAVNEYYDDIAKQYADKRAQYAANNANYDQYLTEQYANSYQNAPLYNIGKAALGANVLSSSILNNYNSTQNDYALMQGQNDLENLRREELANTDYQAKQAYNNAMNYLMTAGKNHNTSDVQNYINNMNYAGSIYASNKNAAAAAAQAYQSQYSGLANASTASNGTTSAIDRLYNMYLNGYNNNATTANQKVASLYEQKLNANN